MPDTFFSAPPHWQWLIVFYFFVGGLAGGSYFLAVVMDMFGGGRHRAAARLGYLVAFPAVVVCAILLTLDLHRPERFWHMLIQSATWRPMFKIYSPMSVGAWALLAFGFFSLVSFLAARSESGGKYASLRPPAPLGIAVTGLGGFFGAFLAGYTGVLLSVTNRPIWADTPLLGLVLLISGASTSAALLMLLVGSGPGTEETATALARLDRWMLLVELVALVGLVASLGVVARAWLNAWGGLLVVGVVGAGIVVPLVLHGRGRGRAMPHGALAALLVILGGFLLRVVVILSAEGV
jgi:formate-dependent nitrite reductase membrane component NrfD